MAVFNKNRSSSRAFRKSDNGAQRRLNWQVFNRLRLLSSSSELITPSVESSRSFKGVQIQLLVEEHSNLSPLLDWSAPVALFACSENSLINSLPCRSAIYLHVNLTALSGLLV